MVIRTNFELVREMFDRFGIPRNSKPAIIDEETYALRRKLILEEAEEYFAAHRAGNIGEVADALADLLVIVYGTGLAYGLPMDRLFAEVARSNLTKTRATSVEQSKRGSTLDLVKGPGYSPPDLDDIIDEALREDGQGNTRQAKLSST